MKAYLKSRRGAIFILAVLTAVLVWCWIQAQDVPTNFQRIFMPEETTITGLNGETQLDNGMRAARDAASGLEDKLNGACEKGTLYSITQPCAVSAEDNGNADARLIGIENGYYGIRELTLYCGRLIYPDELRAAERVAMLDEQLAVAIFKYAEPLGQSVSISGEEYEIVGILRASRKVGMQQNYNAYVPYRALEKSGQSATALVYEAIPVAGSGGWSTFLSDTAVLGIDGTTWSLVKERMNAAMPQRILLCIFGFALSILALRKTTFHVKHLYGRYTEELKNAYPIKLVWRFLPRAALLIVCYAACAFVLARVFMWLLDPVYTFPEWVPAVLVEPKDIETAFWNVWQAQAELMVLRTAEVVRLKFIREVAFWCALIAAAVCGRMRYEAKHKDTNAVMDESIENEDK